MNIRKILSTAACVLAFTSGAAMAQDYPTKPIRLIIPYSAGGITDVLGRLYGQQLSTALGQPVIVENRTGSAGSIGIDLVAKSPADGYTLAFSSNGPLASNYALFKNPTYNPMVDLSPVARLGSIQNILAVHPSVPAKNLGELIALLKANPGKYSYASGGNGTAQHFSGELLKSMAKVDIAHIPYRGEGQSINDAVGGQVPLVFGTASVIVPQIQAGRLRAIAVTSKERSSSLPDVPTIAEAGLPGYELVAWFGVVGPKGLPPAILEKLNKVSREVLATGGVAERFNAIGGTPAPATTAQFRDFIKSEIELWTRIRDLTGASLD
ncbi:Bug family tripartite tricarboxylate transporter substrate binding protein [Hydrogenophaga sp. ANAO-22]|jgi:tripartite-type tricarboxylate transporter receptor subunit TctC|uniref:Bug family tripartite tricarboxylate transporter substrate binding protein n=1 Tax=Hydrogenophaga sp. ANAO-22 TaxID=3166645 RepID=UPI0036D3F3F5